MISPHNKRVVAMLIVLVYLTMLLNYLDYDLRADI